MFKYDTQITAMRGLQKAFFWWMISYDERCDFANRLWPKEPPAKVLVSCDLSKSSMWN